MLRPVSPIQDALVVGRGAVGVTAALALAQIGLQVCLVGPPPAARRRSAESDPDAWDARVFALSGASRGLLESVRAWGAMDATRIAPVYDMRVYPSTRTSAPELHFSAWESALESLAWIVENDHLMLALEQALSFSTVRVIAGQVVALDASDPAATAVTLDDGTVLRTRLVVAADGAASPTRDLLGLDTSLQPYNQHAVVANFETSVPHGDCAWQWFGEHGILAMLPLPGQRTSMVWSAPVELADTLMELDLPALAARAQELTGGVLGTLRGITAQQRFPLRLIQASRMIAPRAVLVGDAAHVVHPLAGQGMNLGFGDLIDLVSVLRDREPFRDPGDRLLLRRYERRRSEPVLAMKLATDGLQRLFDPQPEGPLPVWLRPAQALREVGWRTVQAAPWLKRRLMKHAAS